VSADPPAASRKFREEFGLNFRLLADEKHEVAKEYGVEFSYHNPREWVYAHGFTQPAIVIHAGERQVYRWIQRRRFWNVDGAAFRPSVKKILRVLRSRKARV
jgi:peroxiredoxin